MPPVQTALFDVDLEKAVLGAILSEPQAFRVAASLIQKEAFYVAENRKIFEACSEVVSGGGEVDIVTVSNVLRKSDGERVWVIELSDLLTGNPTAANLEYLCKSLLGFALKRGLLKLSREVSDKVNDSLSDADEITSFVRSRITDFMAELVTGRTSDMPTLITATFAQIEALKASGRKWAGLSTGLVDLDEKLKGLKKGNLIILAARPSMGKTALALRMAKGIAKKEQAPVGIISLEMGADELMIRMLSAEAKVENWRLEAAKLGREHFEKLNPAAATLSELKIIVQDEPSLSISEFEAQAQNLVLKFGIKCLIVDYLQLFTPKTKSEKDAGTQQFTAMISKAMKGVARALQIPIIALSQLSRAPETRGGDRRPMLSDLRDSGAIEQDADIVMFVYRPEYYKPESKTVKLHDKEYSVNGFTEVIIAKNRNGPVGSVPLMFLKDYTEFENHEPTEQGF